MNVLFSLCISRITEENYRAEYPIGLFRSAEDADKTAKRLMRDGGRLSTPDCRATVTTVEVVGKNTDTDCVYRFYGQNVDASADGDIIESPCYTDKQTAIAELMKAKQSTPRKHWSLETLVVGKSNL